MKFHLLYALDCLRPGRAHWGVWTSSPTSVFFSWDLYSSTSAVLGPIKFNNLNNHHSILIKQGHLAKNIFILKIVLVTNSVLRFLAFPSKNFLGGAESIDPIYFFLWTAGFQITKHFLSGNLCTRFWILLSYVGNVKNTVAYLAHKILTGTALIKCFDIKINREIEYACQLR